MYLVVAVLWTIILASNIVLAGMGAEATWTQLFGALTVITLDTWIAYYEYTHKK